MSWRWLRWLMSYCRGEASTTTLHYHYITIRNMVPITVFLCCSVSRPDKVIFPPPNWSVSQSLRDEQDIGPELQQVYEVPQHFTIPLYVRFQASLSGVCRIGIFKTVSLFQLVNNGPSSVSQSLLEVRCPLRAHGHQLLYPVEVVTEGPLSCSSKHTFNALKLKVSSHTQTHTH